MDAEKKMTKEELEKLWSKLGDVPVDNDDMTGSDFHVWPAGTHKYEIWEWFDEMYGKWGGVTALMYGELASRRICAVVMRLAFHTDGDFRICLDGLRTFVNSRLDTDRLKFEFNAKELMAEETRDWEHQVVELSVWLPPAACSVKDSDYVDGDQRYCYVDRGNWASEAIEQVIKPAFAWLFAEMAIGNHHDLTTYLNFREPFSLVDDSFDPRVLRVGMFTDGVCRTPPAGLMSGNYDGWCDFDFALQPDDDSKDWGRLVKAMRKARENWENDFRREMERD